MGDINEFSLRQAEAAAARLWAYGSAPFPIANGGIIQRHMEEEVTDGHRVRDPRSTPVGQRPSSPDLRADGAVSALVAADGLAKVATLRDALNRIVHATQFEVGFERLPDDATRIVGGAIGIIYLSTRTDQRELAFIDVFALASCFFHQVLPVLRAPGRPPGSPAH